MAAASVIEVQDLRKSYRSGLIFRRSHEALKGVSFSVQAGEVFGLLGPNGAGKTTMINVLLGIVRKNGGSATVMGHAAGRRASRKQIGYLPENLRIPRHLNANSALDYYGGLSGLSSREVRARRGALLERVGLADRARDSIKKYSKGMLQRLGLAQALLHEPDLLFLDEPTDGLDPVGRSQVRTMLQELKQAGKTVFLNSHLLQEVEMVCDRVAILDRGVLRGIGSVAEIASGEPKRLEVTFDVIGSQQAVQQVVGKQDVSRCEELAEGQFRVVLRLADQSAIDQTVDGFRRQSVSIVGIARQRATLEEAFLNLLAQPAEET
jgi:ABC-2 type transport system ATP-binding protein